MINPYENQVGGEHYKNVKIQPLWLAETLELKPCDNNILKCIMRDKDGKEGRLKDLNKILDYIAKARFHGRESCFWSVTMKNTKLVRDYCDQFQHEKRMFSEILFWDDYKQLESSVKKELERVSDAK